MSSAKIAVQRLNLQSMSAAQVSVDLAHHHLATHPAKCNESYADLNDQNSVDDQLNGVKQCPRALGHETEDDGEETRQRHATIQIDVAGGVYKAISHALEHL